MKKRGDKNTVDVRLVELTAKFDEGKEIPLPKSFAKAHGFLKVEGTKTESVPKVQLEVE